MRSEELISLINDETLQTVDLQEPLAELIDSYPYFQTARMLYLKNLHFNKDSRYPAQLKKTACYAGDKRRLFFLIEGKLFSDLNWEQLEKAGILEPDDTFELIDFFLSEKQIPKESDHLSATPLDKRAATTDYLSYLLSSETLEQEEMEVAPMKHQETIDQFLAVDQQAPIKIELKNTDDKTPAVLPELEFDEESSFFSETLAKIYLKQKKYERALEIIRKLNLLYPEKNIYFADQIRFLEKLIINTQKIK